MNEKKTTQQHLITEELLFINSSIPESLKFAEAKHTGLVALNSGGIFGVVTIYKEAGALFHWSQIIIIALLIISIILSLWSFYPKYKPKKKKTVTMVPEGNLFYAEGLLTHSTDQIKEILDVNQEKIKTDLINWTHHTAFRTSQKYRLFRGAAYCSVGAVFISLIMLASYTICILIN